MVANLLEGRVKRVSSDLLLKLSNSFFFFKTGNNLYAEYIMRNTGLDETQAGIKIARRNINNLRYTDWHLPYGKKVKKN